MLSGLLIEWKIKVSIENHDTLYYNKKVTRYESYTDRKTVFKIYTGYVSFILGEYPD